MKSPRSLAYAQPYDWEIDGTARQHGLFCVSVRFRWSGAWTLKTRRWQLASRSRYGDVGLSRDLIHLIRTSGRRIAEPAVRRDLGRIRQITLA